MNTLFTVVTTWACLIAGILGLSIITKSWGNKYHRYRRIPKK